MKKNPSHYMEIGHDDLEGVSTHESVWGTDAMNYWRGRYALQSKFGEFELISFNPQGKRL